MDQAAAGLGLEAPPSSRAGCGGLGAHVSLFYVLSVLLTGLNRKGPCVSGAGQEGTAVRGVIGLTWGAVAGAGGHSKAPASGHAKVLRSC